MDKFIENIPTIQIDCEIISAELNLINSKSFSFLNYVQKIEFNE